MTPMDQYQPSLFAETLPAPPPELVALARRLPPSVRFGTSTWTYDGWAGDVYHRPYRGAQPARRLEEYVRYPLFSTVGIDSAFYEPPPRRRWRPTRGRCRPDFPASAKCGTGSRRSDSISRGGGARSPGNAIPTS